MAAIGLGFDCASKVCVYLNIYLSDFLHIFKLNRVNNDNSNNNSTFSDNNGNYNNVKDTYPIMIKL